eukprot:366551-Chlamydomonas_euryale.AAC.20
MRRLSMRRLWDVSVTIDGSSPPIMIRGFKAARDWHCTRRPGSPFPLNHTPWYLFLPYGCCHHLCAMCQCCRLVNSGPACG